MRTDKESTQMSQGLVAGQTETAESLTAVLQLLLLLQSQSGESPRPPAQTETKGLIRLLNTAPFLHPSLHARP
ncbi:hypothetical protein NQZ68_010099 [Dissostichus eleginoides]|nr:hypothetical protein NQZ68_010099 [Dissostichus eleginoides]